MNFQQAGAEHDFWPYYENSVRLIEAIWSWNGMRRLEKCNTTETYYFLRTMNKSSSDLSRALRTETQIIFCSRDSLSRKRSNRSFCSYERGNISKENFLSCLLPQAKEKGI